MCQQHWGVGSEPSTDQVDDLPEDETAGLGDQVEEYLRERSAGDA